MVQFENFKLYHYHPVAFLALIGKVLSMQIAGDRGEPLQTDIGPDPRGARGKEGARGEARQSGQHARSRREGARRTAHRR